MNIFDEISNDNKNFDKNMVVIKIIRIFNNNIVVKFLIEFLLKKNNIVVVIIVVKLELKIVRNEFLFVLEKVCFIVLFIWSLFLICLYMIILVFIVIFIFNINVVNFGKVRILEMKLNVINVR